MKKLTTALLGAALLLSPAAFAQNEQLPNSGFEGEWVESVPWTSNGNTKVCTQTINKQTVTAYTPTDWCISHVIGYNGTGATIMGEKETGYSSSSAVKVSNTGNAMINTIPVPGYITLGKTWSTSVMNKQNDGGTFGGIDFTSRPDAIEFMYKRVRSENKPDEKTTVIAYLWKGTWTQKDVPANIMLFGNPTSVDMVNRDRCVLLDYKNYMSSDEVVWTNNSFTPTTDVVTKGGAITKSDDAELIAVAEITLTEVKEDWTLCHADFTYFSNATPEKFNIIIAAGDYFGGTDALGIGNSLTVDDINLIYSDDYNGYLNIEMGGGELTRDQESTINILTKSSTKCDFTLPNFILNMDGNLLPLGDIKVPDVTITEENGVKTYNGTVKDLSLLGGGIIADATVSGTIDADNFVNMKIDVLWTNTDEDPIPIDVTFTTNAHPVAPTLQINGMDINENEPITVKDGEGITLPMTDGIEIWYALEETSSASYAPSRIPTDKNYKLYDGSALDVKSGKNYNLTYIAKDTKTGLESEPKTVSFSTTTGIAAIEAENGTAEYFTLQGVRVAAPTNGIYIRVANGKATKVTVK